MTTQSAIVRSDPGIPVGRRQGVSWWPFVAALVLGGPIGLVLFIAFRAARSPRARDIIGTTLVLICLMQFTFVFILLEKFLENFKSH